MMLYETHPARVDSKGRLLMVDSNFPWMRNFVLMEMILSYKRSRTRNINAFTAG